MLIDGLITLLTGSGRLMSTCADGTVVKARYFQVTDNIVNGATTAISCRAASNVIIEGNRIDQGGPRQASSSDAIILDTVSNAQVSNNMATTPGTIALANCDRTVVLRNNEGLKPAVRP